MERMKILTVVIFLLGAWIGLANGGSSCPNAKKLLPCACSNRNDGFTMVVCAGIQNSSRLVQATKALKGLYVDHLMMINTFTEKCYSEETIDTNDIFPRGNHSLDFIFPKRWLSELRVKHLDVQNSRLNGYFLFDEVLKGQSDLLTRININNADLSGQLCSSCGPLSNSDAFSTSELRRAVLINHIDLSYNYLETVAGNAFPQHLTQLKTIILSNNLISRVHDNAFSNLNQLSYLDLSNNRLTTLTRKMFRTPSDNSLSTIDLSYNAIFTLPSNMFSALNALKELKLSYNTLETLPENTWSQLPTLLEKVDLRGNFLVCNCSMRWISRRLSKSTKLIAQCLELKSSELHDVKPTLGAINTGC